MDTVTLRTTVFQFPSQQEIENYLKNHPHSVDSQGIITAGFRDQEFVEKIAAIFANQKNVSYTDVFDRRTWNSFRYFSCLNESVDPLLLDALRECGEAHSQFRYIMS